MDLHFDGKYFEDNEKDKNGNSFVFLPKELKFHNSWDWLMPVVQKIENLGFVSYISSNNCSIHTVNFDPKKDDYMCHHTSLTKREAIYHCVIQFINYYNEKIK